MDEFGKNLHFSGREAERVQLREEPRGPSESGPTAALEAEVVWPHFVSRVWSLTSLASAEHRNLVVLASGAGSITMATGDTIAMDGPTACLLPPGSASRLEIEAGATAALLKLKDVFWHRYVLPSAEEITLDLMRLQQPLVLSVEADLAVSLSRSIAALAEELMAPARHGALSIISAELSLHLLRLWRRYGSTQEYVQGNTAELLGRFRRLVEQHFQHHLRVVDFAGQLGISGDRLHAICTRTLGRTPSQLIQQRLIQEAVHRLETSNAPVKQIAFALGFKDTGYFCRFFVKHTRLSPRSWRSKAKDRAKAQRTPPPMLQFSDWP